VRALGAATETEAIHEALRALLIADDLVKDLETARGRGVFRREFVREMRAERAGRR
jgi:hypothetical protein